LLSFLLVQASILILLFLENIKACLVWAPTRTTKILAWIFWWVIVFLDYSCGANQKIGKNARSSFGLQPTNLANIWQLVLTSTNSDLIFIMSEQKVWHVLKNSRFLSWKRSHGWVWPERKAYIELSEPWPIQMPLGKA
jgi:hypothetical protein